MVELSDFLVLKALERCFHFFPSTVMSFVG